MSLNLQSMVDPPKPGEHITSLQVCEALYRWCMFGATIFAQMLGKPKPRSD